MLDLLLLDQFSEIYFISIGKIISEPLLLSKKWVLLLMAKNKYLNLENLLRNCDDMFFK